MFDARLPSNHRRRPLETRPLGRGEPGRTSIAVALALGLGALMPVTGAEALSFGTARLNSALGQPLDLRIPVQSDDPGQLDEACMRLLPAPDSDIPSLGVGRVTVERDGLLTSIRVLSLEPVNEPALRIVLEAGCQRRMQREYVLLLDPPVLRADAPPAPAGPPAQAPAALELGPAEIRAMRGRPLLIRVPLRGADAARLTSECVRTIGDEGSPPALDTARARLVNAGSASPVLEITTREALIDRTVRVVTELGCERPIRREFDLLVETVPMLSDADTAPAPAPATTAPAARAPRPPAPPARPRPSVVPAVPAAPAAAAPPAVTAAPAPAPAPAAAAPAPAPAPPAEMKAAPKDRLVLAAPEDAPVAPPSAPAIPPTQTDEFVKRLDELATEVKRLRAELDAANQRNAALSEKLARGDSINLGWALAAGAALLFAGMLWLSNRRSAPSRTRAKDELDAEGPMTRIVGHREKSQRPGAAAPSAGAPTLAGAVGGTLMTAPLSDVRSQNSEDIQVTEMGDEEAIRELYADFVSRQNSGGPDTIRLDVPARSSARLGDATRFESGTRFGDDVPATRMTVPLTTQLAVDIDLTPDTPTQQPTQPLPAAGSPTATRPLELDLELHLPGQSPKRPEPEQDDKGDAGDRRGAGEKPD